MGLLKTLKDTGLWDGIKDFFSLTTVPGVVYTYTQSGDNLSPVTQEWMNTVGEQVDNLWPVDDWITNIKEFGSKIIIGIIVIIVAYFLLSD